MAAVAALVAWISVATGGAAVPAAMTLGKYIALQAAIGFGEGLLYGALSEILGAKQANAALQAMHLQQGVQPSIEQISDKEMHDRLRHRQATRVGPDA